MTANCLKLSAALSAVCFACTFGDNTRRLEIYIIYAPLARGYAPFIADRCLVEITGDSSSVRQMILSAFILLLTFMCISRHDRRDNRARCIIVNVSQFLLLRVVLASHCRLSFHNRTRVLSLRR